MVIEKNVSFNTQIHGGGHHTFQYRYSQRVQGRFRIYGLGGGQSFVLFASKIKPALSEAKQKIQAPAGGQKFYLPPSMIFQLEKLKCLKTPY